MKILLRYLPFWLICLASTGLYAQKVSQKIADKQFDLHAYQAAAEAYQSLLDAGKDDPEILNRLALCYYHTGRPAEATGFFEKAVQFKSVDPITWLWYAKALQMNGLFEKSQSALREYRNVVPEALQLPVWQPYPQTVERTYTIERLGISSPATDFGISFVGEDILFNSFNPKPANPPAGWVSGEQYHYLYKARCDSQGKPGEASLLKKGLTIDYHEGPAAVSPNGREVVFMRAQFNGFNRLTPESGFQSSLFIADVRDNGHWENIRPFPFNGTGYSTAWPAWAPDGQSLYFASDKPGGKGGFDLYQSERKGMEWAPPAPVSDVINTPGHEITPFVVEDRLFFASDFHPGYGGFDLFQAFGSQPQDFTLVHLGPDINSTMDDLGLIMRTDLRTAYFSSNRQGNGDLDLFMGTTEALPVIIKVLDAHTNQPVANAVVISDSDRNESWTSDGEGLIRLPGRKNWQGKYKVSHPSYLEVTQDFRLLGIKKGLHQIALRPTDWLRTASIRNASSDQPVEGALVRITDQRTGLFQDLTSNAAGEVHLPLSPGGIFFINITRNGFLNNSRTLHVATRPEDVQVDPFLLVPVPSATPVAASPGKGENDQAMQSGHSDHAFAVQVASLAPGPQADVTPFQSLSRFGTVYQKEGNDRVRIRVGLFATRQEAEKAAAGIRESGYPDAFPVEEHSETLMDQVMISLAKGKESHTGTGSYLVRLAAYRNPQWFEPGGLEAFGKVVEERSGEWTIKYLTGVKSLSDAKEALALAHRNGFKEAYILYEKGGLRTRMD